jgi:hypothetical protein
VTSALDLDVDRRERQCGPHGLSAWYAPDDESERRALDAWCDGRHTAVDSDDHRVTESVCNAGKRLVRGPARL